jgi:uncharacterized iron-regulated membrane protein
MSATIDNTSSGRRRDAFRLIWRWHFYAGLFCLPFILWLASTGMIYLFRPQIEPLLEQRYAHVAKGSLLPPSAQVAAALRAVPGGVLNAYELPSSPDAATRVLVGRGPELIRVFVNPSDGRVLHVVRDKDRFMRVIFYLHGELLMGDKGSMLVELAASWTILMLLSGLYLWWPRGGRVAGVLYPRTGQGKRVFWRDIHAVTGVWVSLFALFLLTSGLPWTKSWGGMLSAVRHTYAANAVAQDWTTGSSSEIAQRVAMNTPADEHAGHAGMSGMGDMSMMSMMSMGADYSALDLLVNTVSAQQLPPPVLISPPSKRTPTWSAHSDTANRPLRVDLVLDGASGGIVSRAEFAQKPLLDRIIAYGVAIHEGQLFGPLNQAFGVFTALGMITLAVSAIVMWWRRRPRGVLGAPPAHADMRYPRVFVGLLVVLGVVLPLLGVSMLVVLLLERLVLRRFHRARHFLGLAAIE